jgi:hypothetical protein
MCHSFASPESKEIPIFLRRIFICRLSFKVGHITNRLLDAYLHTEITRLSRDGRNTFFTDCHYPRTVSPPKNKFAPYRTKKSCVLQLWAWPTGKRDGAKIMRVFLVCH